MTIVFTAPVFSLILAWIFLAEDLGLHKILVCIAIMIGIVLIARPEFIFPPDHENHCEDESLPKHIIGVLTALSSSLLAAGGFVMIRKMVKTPLDVINLWFSVFTFVGALLMLICVLYIPKEYTGQMGVLSQHIYWPTSAKDIAILLGTGILAVIGQTCVTLAIKIEEAGIVALIRTFDVVLAFLLQISFLSEPVTWTSIAGAVIVCTAVSVSVLKKWLEQKSDSKYNRLFCIVNCGNPEAELEDGE